MKASSAISCMLLITIASALPLSSPIAPRQDDLEEITDHLLFEVSIEEFETARAARDPPELDWSSNGCTSSPDEPLGYDFTQSCHRHDFGYHNYQNQDRFSDTNKDKIDSNFKDDMYNECEEHSTVSEAVCKGVADVYYEAVSAFGGKRDLEA